MLRTVRAFLWMRWRVSRNAFKSRRRDSMEQISRALGALAPYFLILMLVPTVLALCFGAAILGYQIGQAGSAMVHRGIPFVGIRIGLAIQTAVVLIAPMVRSARGTGSETTRLMLLPINRRMLHASEVIGALSDPWLGVLFPALMVFPLAIIAGGSVAGGLFALIGAILFVTIVMLAVSLASFSIALLFRQRRRAEWFTIVVITALSMSGLFFGLWAEKTEGRIEIKREAKRVGIENAAEQEPGRNFAEHFDHAVPAATKALPSEVFLHLVRVGVAGNWAEVALQMLLLGGCTTVLYAGSRWTYGRLLETPETGGGTRKAGRRSWRVTTLPWTSPAVSAVALSTMRLALRTVRGKTGVYLNFVVIGMLYFVLRMNAGEFELPDGVGFGMAIGLLGAFFTLLSLQPILINIFAIDANGLTLQLLSPVSTRQLMRGKLIGGAMLSGISMVLCFVTGFVLDPGGSPLLWLTALLVSASLFLVFGPVALFLSAVFPKVADLSRMGKDGNPQPIAATIATFGVPLLLVPPGLLVAGSILIAKSPALALLAASVWFVICVLLCALLVRSAGSLFERRRENLLLVATGR